MVYQIDQSGKVEDTSSLTIVAVANGKTKTLKIAGREKRKAILVLRKQDYPKKVFIYKLFAALIYLLLKGEKISEVIIDKEYPGHEATIKLILVNFYRKFQKLSPQIHFMEITKNSPAHKIAIETYRGKIKPDMVVNSEEVLILFKSNKKGWRSRVRR